MAVEAPSPVDDVDYHFREESLTTPVFFGKGAQRLGIEGLVVDTEYGKQVYMNLFKGYATTPDGQQGEKLAKYMHPNRRGAFQIVANNPKEVSVLNLVGGDERIEGVMHEAYAALARFVEQTAEVKVSDKARRGTYAKPDNLVMVLFEHGANRNGDPHRHGHLVAFNLSNHEGKNKGLEFYKFDFLKASEVYRDAMRKELHRLGYKTRLKGAEYEIVGFPAEVKAKFSSRREGIEDKVAAFEEKIGKSVHSKTKRRFGVFDRPDKEDKPLVERVADWVSQMTRRQWGMLRDLVETAVYGYARTRARAAYRAHVANRLDLAMVQDTASHGHERSRSDGGIER